MMRNSPFRYSVFPLGIALTLPLTPLASASESDFAVQDARERKAALDFAERRGLDISKAVESETGLWSLVIEPGVGRKVTASDTITAHYTSWLSDGTKFWSTHDGPGKPTTSLVTRAVKGFSEGVQTMRAGGTSLLIFPGHLGYGPRGNPRANIPPNATLVYEVELLAVNGVAPAPEPTSIPTSTLAPPDISGRLQGKSEPDPTPVAPRPTPRPARPSGKPPDVWNMEIHLAARAFADAGFENVEVFDEPGCECRPYQINLLLGEKYEEYRFDRADEREKFAMLSGLASDTKVLIYPDNVYTCDCP